MSELEDIWHISDSDKLRKANYRITELEKELTQARARTAATLRDAADIAHHWKDRDEPFMPRIEWENDTEQRILALITCDERAALQRIEAGVRLQEFDLIMKERPCDPVYWDMHHRRALVEALHDRSAGGERNG